MDSVTYSENRIMINSHEIELDEDVAQVVTTDDVILVRCTKGELDPTNLLAFDGSGNQIWRIAPLKKFEADSTRAVKAIDKREDFIQIRDLDGDRYKLNPQTGETEFLGGSH